MALHNEILVGRFNRALQKLFGIKGGPVSPQLGGEIMPVYVVDRPVEERVQYGWSRFLTGILVPANAGFAGGVRFRVPLASNVIAVLEKVDVQFGIPGASASALSVGSGATGADLASLAPVFISLDPRAQANPSMSVSGQTNPVLLSNTSAFIAPPNTINYEIDIIRTINQEMVITPGNALQFAGNLVNTPMQVGLIWRERFLEEGERT